MLQVFAVLYLLGWGGLFFGYGSLLLRLFGREFALLDWAEPMQPMFGVVAGSVGLVLVIAGAVYERAVLRPRRAAQEAQRAA